MSTTELRAPILAALHRVLKPAGFGKAAAVFSRQSGDVVHLIELQGSRSNRSAEARFTVNVGIFAPAIVYPDVRDVRKPSIAGSHWRERLGSLSPERED